MKKFFLRTDHRALKYLNTSDNTNSRLLRWSLILQEYSFVSEYIKGELNPADGIGRHVLCNSLNLIDNKHNLSFQIINNRQKEEILMNSHLLLAHGSYKNMQYYLSNKFHWNNINEDIKNCIEKCLICLKSVNKIVNTKNIILESKNRNDLWQVDLIGKVKRTDGKNKFILVLIDHFSKWLEAEVIETKDAKTTSQIIEKIILKNGIPNKIISDNGLEFSNQYMKRLTDKYGFVWKYNSRDHHKTVSCVERTNQTLLRKLKKINNFEEDGWESKINKAVLAYNISFNRVLQSSPHEFRYGKTYDGSL